MLYNLSYMNSMWTNNDDDKLFIDKPSPDYLVTIPSQQTFTPALTPT